MNGTRLTLFDMMKAKGTNVTAAGVGAGVIAGGIASPFYMLKTQQQALSSVQGHWKLSIYIKGSP